MTGSTRSILTQVLGDRYLYLRDRLARRLGSRDRATEALHDTWLRLQSGSELGPVSDPDAYLYRAALNNASRASAIERRLLDTVEIDSALNLTDEAPGPERIAIARNELEALKRALAKLSARQRDIFMASYIGDASHAELAKRYKVSIRTIQVELRIGLLHVATQLIGKDVCATQDIKVSRNR